MNRLVPRILRIVALSCGLSLSMFAYAAAQGNEGQNHDAPPSPEEKKAMDVGIQERIAKLPPHLAKRANEVHNLNRQFNDSMAGDAPGDAQKGDEFFANAIAFMKELAADPAAKDDPAVHDLIHFLASDGGKGNVPRDVPTADLIRGQIEHLNADRKELKASPGGDPNMPPAGGDPNAPGGHPPGPGSAPMPPAGPGGAPGMPPMPPTGGAPGPGGPGPGGAPGMPPMGTGGPGPGAAHPPGPGGPPGMPPMGTGGDPNMPPTGPGGDGHRPGHDDHDAGPSPEEIKAMDDGLRMRISKLPPHLAEKASAIQSLNMKFHAEMAGDSPNAANTGDAFFKSAITFMEGLAQDPAAKDDPAVHELIHFIANDFGKGDVPKGVPTLDLIKDEIGHLNAERKELKENPPKP